MSIRWSFQKDMLVSRFLDDRHKLTPEMLKAVIEWLNSGKQQQAEFLWLPKLDVTSKLRGHGVQGVTYRFERGMFQTPPIHEGDSRGKMVHRPAVRYHAARCTSHPGIEIIGKNIDPDPHSILMASPVQTVPDRYVM